MSEMVGTPRMIKLLNKDVIEGIIKANGPITKPEIAKLSNLSLVTVNKIVDLLLQEKKVKVSDVKGNTVGRKAQYFEVNEELYYLIGLNYIRNLYIGVVANSIGEIIFRQEYPVRPETKDTALEDTCSALDALKEYCSDHRVAAIGLGVPGVVKDGVVTNIPSIPGWEGVNIAACLEEVYKIEVFLENDINLAAIGVYYSKYKDRVDNLGLVYLDESIGSGLILGRELFKGSTNFAGELGYLPIYNGKEALSDKTECFEDSVVRLERELKEGSGNKKKLCKEELRKTIAKGLLSLICVINPEVIVLVCDSLSRGDIKMIEDLLKEWIGEEHVAKMTKLDDIQKQSIYGLVSMCLREISPTYSLSSRKRG